MGDLKYKYNSEIICPYCDHEHRDSYNFYEGMSDGDLSNFFCHSCFKEFSCEVHYTRSYSTSLQEEGGQEL